MYGRTTRVVHPPVLQRGSQKLTYGPGANAPWNSSFSPAPAATPATAQGGGGGGKGKGAANGGPDMPNGKDKDGATRENSNNNSKEAARPLPDARFFATWSYEPKRFDDALPVRRRVGGGGGVGPPGGGGGRARSESMHP